MEVIQWQIMQRKQDPTCIQSSFFVHYFHTEGTFEGFEAGEEFPVNSFRSKAPAVLRASFHLLLLQRKYGKKWNLN